MLCDTGKWSFTPGLPKLLHNKLNGHQAALPTPECVALGSQDRYFIRFSDGECEWVGPDCMEKKIDNKSQNIKTIALGKNWDSFFIVYKNGGYCYQDVPIELDELIKSRGGRTDLDCVSLGPDNEYYVSVKNGRAWWSGSNEFAKAVRKVKNRVKFIDFGDDGIYLYRHVRIQKGRDRVPCQKV